MTDVKAELQRTLATLVAIDSTSSRSNAPMIEQLVRWLEPEGWKLTRLPYVDDAGLKKENLVAVSPQHASASVAELALVGHTDCVPFDADWKEALTLTEKDGKLYGRGACDTKAFIACAVTAARSVKAVALPRPVTLIFTADEEVGCVGAKELVTRQQGRARYAIVGEPTSLTPIRAHKGYCLAQVEVEGREGHSAYPSQGAPAIFRAARLLTRLEEEAEGALRQLEDVLFDPPYTTVNVGLIHGGKAKNIIPGNCSFTVEWRPIPGQSPQHVAGLLQKLVDEAKAREPDFVAHVHVLRGDSGVATPADATLVRYLEGVSGKRAGTVSFGTEAPQLTELGAQAVVFGPGNIQVAHRTGEFVPIDELLRCEQILEGALQHFAG